MAEVAKSVVRDNSITGEAGEDDVCRGVEPLEEISLQELIDNELALRVPPAVVNSSPIKPNHCFTNDFLTAEREHSSEGLDDLMNNDDDGDGDVRGEHRQHQQLVHQNNHTSSPTVTTSPASGTARFNLLTLNNEKNNPRNATTINGDNNGLAEEETGHNNNNIDCGTTTVIGGNNLKNILIEHQQKTSDHNKDGQLIDVDEESTQHEEQGNNDDWTTVEEVAREMVSGNGGGSDGVDNLVIIDGDNVGDKEIVVIDKDDIQYQQHQYSGNIGNGHILVEDGQHHIENYNNSTATTLTTNKEYNTSQTNSSSAITEYITTTTRIITTTTTTTTNGATESPDENDSVETSVTEKKKKKKTINENGEVVVTKTKKTKKSKKTEEKENHINIITNGHHGPSIDDEEDEAASNTQITAIDDDELSNVCVKDLKLTYVNEANKSFSPESKKCSEVPVLPPVPIRELKSSFSKFDQLSKKVLHVRSSDPSKATKTFSQGGPDGGATSTCKACNKTVFAMEQIKAERAVWHKNCFRCHTCNKQLTVDIYSSHEGELYCKPHFKELFKPKVIIDDEEPASDKPDLGLEELSSLNVKKRFEVFEKQDTTDNVEKPTGAVSVKRSSSILSKLAKFQKKGMDVGVSDDALNGFVYEESESSEDEEEDDEEEEEKGIIKCRRKMRERPVSFTKIDDVKKNWESQHDMMTRREEMREQRKEELQQIRSRLFMGKQGKMKELYEQAVAESEGKTGKKEVENDIVRSERARVVREKFEKGEPVFSDDEETGVNKNINKGVEEDMSVFEEGISKKSRSIFLEMDANAVKTQHTAAPMTSPPPRDSMVIKKGREVYYSRQASDDVVKSSDVIEDVAIETADLSSKFKFFETYKAPEKERKTFRITPPREGQVKTESPEREVYRDPDVVRADDKLEDEKTILKSQTASRMLSMFRQLEEQKEIIPEGVKPKKCFTPPPDYKGSAGTSEDESDDDEEDDEDEEEEEESETEDGVVKSSYKVKDEFLEKAKNAAKAKALAAKFESWEPEKQSNNNAITMLDSEHASIDSTKSLRAKFESLKTEQPKEKARPKVNRFVETGAATLCASCNNKVYPLEKVETNGKVYHKACFRCSYCNCILRMDSYTLNNDQLYCLPHYKQLFIAKGNYDEGFGSDQHKRKWDSPNTATNTTTTTTAC